MSKANNLVELKNSDELTNFTQQPGINLVLFTAPWSISGEKGSELMAQLAVDYPNAFAAAAIDAENIAVSIDISKYNINAVPTIIAFRGGKTVGRVDGVDEAVLRDLIVRLSFEDGIPPSITETTPTTATTTSAQSGPASGADSKVEKPSADAKVAEKNESLENRLEKLINTSRLMLFMKGDPKQPRCGFSRQIIQLLDEVNAEYATFDILSDEEVRQGLKEYVDWPTYPQLYLNGEFLGGLDVVREEMKDAQFVAKLPKRA